MKILQDIQENADVLLGAAILGGMMLSLQPMLIG